MISDCRPTNGNRSPWCAGGQPSGLFEILVFMTHCRSENLFRQESSALKKEFRRFTAGHCPRMANSIATWSVYHLCLTIQGLTPKLSAVKWTALDCCTEPPALSVQGMLHVGESRGYSWLMSVEQIVGLSIAVVLMLIGLAGSVLPGIPGAPLILAAAVGHRLYFGQAGPSTLVLGLLAGLTLLSLGLDYLATMIGAKKLGATWRGMVGAALGGLIGLILGPVGLLVGPLVGATALEMLSGRDIESASRAGAGAFIGLLAGAVGKVACCLSMIGLFLFDVLRRTYTG